MKKLTLLLLLFICVVAGYSQPGTTTPTPESLGISSQAILNFVNAVEKTRKDDLHSFTLLRHGQVAAEGWWNPYNPDSPHMLFSLSKSFTSTAIGLAQAEGLLNVHDRVISFFPDDTPKDPSQNLKAMSIHDLLRMNSGHNDDATGRMREDTVNWVRSFLALPVEHKPGTHFVYNSAATFMCSAIIQKVTGKTVLEYLTPRLFQPLGIENPTWENAPGGINVGGWGLKIRTKDIANFGQLYLQKGMWKGKQLVPASWVEEATKFQTSNGSNVYSDWEQGYGYQFWRCRYNLYRGDGAFGQYCIVFPEQDAVLAITSGTGDMGAIMNLVWDNILPALKDKPLAENKEVYTALQNKLHSLTLSTVEGKPTSPLVKSIANKPYTVQPNDDGITGFVFDQKQEAITFTKGSKSFSIALGKGESKRSTVSLPNGDLVPAASSGAWISPDTYQVRAYMYETPFYFTYNIVFNKNDVAISRVTNVGFGPASKYELKGSKK